MHIRVMHAHALDRMGSYARRLVRRDVEEREEKRAGGHRPQTRMAQGSARFMRSCIENVQATRIMRYAENASLTNACIIFSRGQRGSQCLRGGRLSRC